MAFVIDEEELKPGLVVFRRGDIGYRRWYCRIKVPEEDRYKTISLKTMDKESARGGGTKARAATVGERRRLGRRFHRRIEIARGRIVRTGHAWGQVLRRIATGLAEPPPESIPLALSELGNASSLLLSATIPNAPGARLAGFVLHS